MAVGTLNVAVTASTLAAQKAIHELRREIGGLGPAAGDAGRHLDNFSRFDQLKRGVNQVKNILKGLLAAPVGFGIGLHLGQQIRGIVESTNSWADAHKNLLAVLTGGETTMTEYQDRMARLQKIIDAQGEANKKRAEEEREAIKTREREIAAFRLESQQRLQAGGDPDELMALQTMAKFGTETGFNLAQERMQAINAERAHEAWLKRQQEDRFAAKEAAEKKLRDDERAREKELRDTERRNAKTLSAQKGAVAKALGAVTGVDSGLSLTQAGTAESFRQRAAIGKQNEGIKLWRKQVDLLTQIRDRIGTDGAALMPANI